MRLNLGLQGVRLNRRDERLRIRGSFGVQCICVYCVKSLGSRDWRGRGRGGGRDGGERKKVILPRAISLFKSVLAIQLRLACVSHYNGWHAHTCSAAILSHCKVWCTTSLLALVRPWEKQTSGGDAEVSFRWTGRTEADAGH